MTRPQYPDEFLERLKAITNKRARIVIEHILQHGFITTEELESQYGYKHPPRAARDVREQGIPLETFKVKSSEGRTIGAYRFGDPASIRKEQLGGRRLIPKAFKRGLIEAQGARCSVCSTRYEARYLQVDHCVPYEVGREPGEANRKIQDYMLLCATCNRAKSWSCEHCTNWHEIKSADLCLSCYWANPVSYRHIALRAIRRLDIVWDEDEVAEYEKLKQYANRPDEALPDFVKKIIGQYLETSEISHDND